VTNPILDELRQIREKLLEDAGGTLEGLVARLQENQRKSECEVYTRKAGTGRQQLAATEKSNPRRNLIDDESP
jgi:hypothetical protein